MRRALRDGHLRAHRERYRKGLPDSTKMVSFAPEKLKKSEKRENRPLHPLHPLWEPPVIGPITSFAIAINPPTSRRCIILLFSVSVRICSHPAPIQFALIQLQHAANAHNPPAYIPPSSRYCSCKDMLSPYLLLPCFGPLTSTRLIYSNWHVQIICSLILVTLLHAAPLHTSLHSYSPRLLHILHLIYTHSLS